MKKSKLKANAVGNWTALGDANPEEKDDDMGGIVFDDGNGRNEHLVEAMMEEATIQEDLTNTNGGGTSQWEGVY